jgi:hypothetical protein
MFNAWLNNDKIYLEGPTERTVPYQSLNLFHTIANVNEFILRDGRTCQETLERCDLRCQVTHNRNSSPLSRASFRSATSAVD